MSVYNEDELTAPNWMDQAFFERVLTQYENGEAVTVTKFELSPASMKGDHYASIMFRSKVTYTFSEGGPHKDISLILKTMPEVEGQKKEFLAQTRVFETEIDMYGTVLPKFGKLLAEHGDHTTFAPKLLYHSLTPVKVIVMEDLCVQGYEIVRGRYLNDDEIKMIYRKLAKMHAVSFLLGKQPETRDSMVKFEDGMFSSSLFLANQQLLDCLKYFEEMLTVHEEFDEYIPKFRGIQTELFAAIKQLYRSSQSDAKDEIMVLNHGDFHLKNIMFKHSKKINLEDLLLVDFQLSVFAPSTVDLFYSVFMLMSPEMRLQKRNSYLHYYFDHFTATLKLLKYDGEFPKFANLKMSFIRYRHFAVYMLTTFLPMVHGFLAQDPEKLKNSGFDMDKPDALQLLYRNPEYIADLKKLLPSLLNDGYID